MSKPTDRQETAFRYVRLPAGGALASQDRLRRRLSFGEGFIERSPVTTLLAASLVCALLLMLVMAALINGGLLQRLPPVNADKDLYSAIGSLFQGIVGSSFALAGSIVAIYLAVLGLRVVREQERREQEQYVRSYLTEALQPINKIARSVSELTVAYISLRQPPPTTTPEAIGAYFKGRTDKFEKAILSLVADMESMYLSPQSLHLWKVSNTNPQNYLSQLWGLFNPHTPCTNATEDPVRFAAYLKAGADTFRMSSEGSGVLSEWQTREQLIRGLIRKIQEENHVEFDFDETEFTGMGASIWLTLRESEGKYKAFNFGLAMLLDIVDAIPDEGEIRRFVAQEFNLDMGDAHGDLFAARIRQFIHNNEPAQLAEPRLVGILERWQGGIQKLYFATPLPEKDDGDEQRAAN